MKIIPILAIYVIAFIAYIAYSRRRQAKAQEDRFSGLAKGAEVETIGGLIAIVDEVDKENNRIVLDAEGVFLTFDLSRSIMKEQKLVKRLSLKKIQPLSLLMKSKL